MERGCSILLDVFVSCYYYFDTFIQLKDINHTNVNPFRGIFQQGPDFHVLWNVCQKGSLQDVLQNDDIECDWTFRLSFASDIAKVQLKWLSYISPLP